MLCACTPKVADQQWVTFAKCTVQAEAFNEITFEQDNASWAEARKNDEPRSLTFQPTFPPIAAQFSEIFDLWTQDLPDAQRAALMKVRGQSRQQRLAQVSYQDLAADGDNSIFARFYTSCGMVTQSIYDTLTTD